MVNVSFTSSFSAVFGSSEGFEVEAATLRELMRALIARYPHLQHQVDAGIALAVNGEIYRDDWDVVIPDGAEVFLMPRIQGG